MPQRDTMEFLAAFALGILAGAAAALLLRPEPPTRAERIRRRLAPYAKRVPGGEELMVKRATRARHSRRKGVKRLKLA